MAGWAPVGMVTAASPACRRVGMAFEATGGAARQYLKTPAAIRMGEVRQEVTCTHWLRAVRDPTIGGPPRHRGRMHTEHGQLWLASQPPDLASTRSRRTAPCTCAHHHVWRVRHARVLLRALKSCIGGSMQGGRLRHWQFSRPHPRLFPFFPDPSPEQLDPMRIRTLRLAQSAGSFP